MANLAIITIHGMGETEANYADALESNLRSRLAAEWAQISYQSVYYQGLLQENQKRLFAKMERHLSYKELRKFLLFGFSDAASLESSRSEPQGVYVQAQLQILETLRRAYADLGGAGKVAIVAQSLGGQVLSNYIWDAQHPGRCGIWRDIHQYVNVDAAELAFLKLETLHRLFTSGCNIPIFVAGHHPIMPIAPPNPQFRWFNFYDADDVLGWALQPLSDEYERLVEDIPCNAGSGIQGWLSHGNYWGDRGFLEALEIEIRKSLS
jgi:hypothetical protein